MNTLLGSAGDARGCSTLDMIAALEIGTRRQQSSDNSLDRLPHANRTRPDPPGLGRGFGWIAHETELYDVGGVVRLR